MSKSKFNKTVEIEIDPMVSIKEIKYHIPTFEEIVEKGTRLGVDMVSESVAKEIEDLLDSDNVECLTMEDFNKIKELIMNEEFRYSAIIYGQLCSLYDHFDEDDPMFKEYDEMMISMVNWAYDVTPPPPRYRSGGFPIMGYQTQL